MNHIAMRLVLSAVLAAAAWPAAAQVQGGVAVTVGTRGGGHWHRGGHWHGGWGPRVGIGIGFAAPIYYGAYGAPYPYYAPGYRGYDSGTLLVAPPPVVYETGPVPPAPMTLPEPVFYPQRHQSAAQTEADRRECNRWAIGQQNAMGDATVFHRATLACMEGKGYVVR